MNNDHRPQHASRLSGAPGETQETPAARPYVALIFESWEASGHQCWDIYPAGCADVIPERKVTARGGDGERLVGFELGTCPACGAGGAREALGTTTKHDQGETR